MQSESLIGIRSLEVDLYVGKFCGKWSIICGNYRVIYMVADVEIIVMLYDTGRRKKAIRNFSCSGSIF